jgi:hypothetical protein
MSNFSLYNELKYKVSDSNVSPKKKDIEIDRQFKETSEEDKAFWKGPTEEWLLFHNGTLAEILNYKFQHVDNEFVKKKILALKPVYSISMYIIPQESVPCEVIVKDIEIPQVIIEEIELLPILVSPYLDVTVTITLLSVIRELYVCIAYIQTLQIYYDKKIVKNDISPVLEDGWQRDLLCEGIEPNPGPRRVNGKPKKKMGKKFRRKNNNSSNRFETANKDSRVPRNMNNNLIVPRIATHALVYMSDVVGLSGGTFQVKSFVANGLFDPDPAILTTGYAGFSYLMKAYYEYLVKKLSMRVTLINKSDVAVISYIIFGSEDLTATIATWQ